MNKRITIILASILLVFIGGFIYLKYFFLKAKDFKPDNSKAQNVIDLRPSIIAKLQQLVKDGSNGLYVLSIEKIDPDIVASTLDVFNANLRVDSVAMQRLDQQKLLPDDVFNIHFDSLHIDGIGLDYLLHSKSIDIARVNIGKPSIEIFHKLQLYNESVRDRFGRLSLYKQIEKQMNSIKIGHINIDNGMLIVHDGPHQKNINRLSDVSIHITDLQVDSSTQFDASRILFSKGLDIDAKNYVTATGDSLYYFKAGSLSVSAANRKAIFDDVELSPRGNKEQFESKLKWRKEMFHLLFKKVELDDLDWWSMINREKFMAKEGRITGGLLNVYFDKRLPAKPGMRMANFPHQLLMKLAIPVAVDHLELKDVDVAYEEFNPLSKQSGTAYFDKLKGQLNNASNIPSQIKLHPIADFSAEGSFMHHVPIKAAFTFDLAKHKTGEFSVDVKVGAIDHQTVNLLAEPLGLFSIKSGETKEGGIHIEGNNLKTSAKLAISYSDLHIDPLKKADENGELKKKHVSSFIANAFLIKNANPEKGKALREPEYTVERDHHGNFFNMIWNTALTGLLKTIGVPVKLVIH